MESNKETVNYKAYHSTKEEKEDFERPEINSHIFRSKLNGHREVEKMQYTFYI